MPKIIVDARESGSSTGRYIDKLVEHLHTLEPTEEFIILTKPERTEFIKSIAPDFTVLASPFKEFTFAEQRGFKHQLDRLGADLVHFGMVQQPIRYQGKVITTIHDLITTRFKNPDKNPAVYWLKQQIYKYVIKRAVRKSKTILTPTQFVKDDLVAYTKVNPNKVIVTLEAADPITAEPTSLPALENKQFIMYVGRPTPHKNLNRLIEAFAALHATHSDLLLVLAGKKDRNYEHIEAGIDPVLKPYVHFTGFVSDGELRWLYEHCAAYIFPSLSEGFGLPGLEAMVHGAPVLSSNATCLPEVYGEAAHYFDPLNVAAMARAIDDVLTDDKLRTELIQKGKTQVAQYSWQRTAKQTLAAYRQVLENS